MKIRQIAAGSNKSISKEQISGNQEMTPMEQLKNLMSEISERCWYAGWLMHTEFVIDPNVNI